MTTHVSSGHHHHGEHDHDHDHASLDAHCAARGLKLTTLRRAVYEALHDAPGAMGAYDLIEAVANRGQRRLAPVSIYRVLDFLLQAGLAHKIESRNAYVVCPHRHGTDDVVIFMICDDCGRVSESTSEPVQRALLDIARQYRFLPKGQVIEMHGRCGACGQPEVMTA